MLLLHTLDSKMNNTKEQKSNILKLMSRPHVLKHLVKITKQIVKQNLSTPCKASS